MDNHELPVSAATLVDLLRGRAEQQPDRRAFTFLLDGESTEQHLTYAELDQQARAIGALLQAAVAPGERALLLYPPGLEYIAAFFGCLYAGVIAVPAYPPHPARLERTFPRLRAIALDAQPAVALTTTAILPMAEALFAQAADTGGLRWLATDRGAGEPAAWHAPTIGDATLAFLQYTSGSTGTPKGVMLTHGNLLHNSALIRRYFAHGPDSRGVIWLPPYHDMGLIGGIIQPLYAGFPVVLMSPVAFLQQPLRWLQAISKYRATTSGGPNFAFDLCVRKSTPEQRASLDLSSWKVAFSGAEPVRTETLDRFAATFGPSGFRREAFYPCYGLAEATLIASGGEAAEPPLVRSFQAEALGRNQALDAPASDEPRLLVGCGRSAADQQIVIADPQSLVRCSPRQVGEIWVRGPSIAQGYWRREEQTEQTFQARLADSGEGPFLRTGDLGCLIDGELFITGRLKDLLIIRGVNHYPHDIEQTVEQSHAALRPGCGAAFAVEVEGEERLVVAQELDRQHRQANIDAVIGVIREAVAREHELQVYAVLLLKTGSIPKTSSGKIQRHACRDGFLDHTLEVQASSMLELAHAEPAQDLDIAALRSLPAERREQALIGFLRGRVAAALRVDPAQVEPQLPLSALGLDSLMAIELSHDLEAALGLPLQLTSLLDGSSIAKLAAALLPQLDTPPEGAHERLTEVGDEAAALSYGQRSLWFMHRLAPESAAYTIAGAVCIRGDLDVAALQRAFQRVIQRHPALRTTFPMLSDEPTPALQEHAEIDFYTIEAAGWSEQSLQEQLALEARRPFDLERGPLLRVRLFRRAARESLLLLAVHHIAADFWSLGIIVDELRQLYAAERAGAPIELPAAGAQYADNTRRQLQMLDGPQGQQLWRYWQEQVGDGPPPLNLPTDRPRPPAQTDRGAAYAFRLGHALTEQLKALGRREGTTLYTTLLAALQVLLHRYTGQNDITVGSPMAGRTRDAFAGAVGYYVNPVVLRADLSADPPFIAFLKQARRTVLAALDHQEYPFPLLVERLQLQRDPSYAPLFQVMFVFQKEHTADSAGLGGFALGDSGARMPFGDLELEALPLEQRAAQFDLTLMAAEVDGEIAAQLQYRTDLFDAPTIERMAAHFQTLLEGATNDPDCRISALPLLPANEQRLLQEWNATTTVAPLDGCIHALFEAQAARTPEATALIWQDQRLTYRELNGRANQLAHELRARGIGPESLVGVCLERTPELVIGLLGVLKAGGAYVPLDPAYPQERIQYMLEDSAVAVLLTTQEQRIKNKEQSTTERKGVLHTPPADDIRAYSTTPPPNHGQPTVLDLVSDWPTIAQQPTENLDSGARAEHLAYVIYTSGSTGRPKGVAIEHRSAVAMLHWAKSIFAPEDLAGVLASTSICFDLSIFELFVPLSWGGTVILARDALQLPALPVAGQVTLVNTVPSAMAELVRSGGIPAGVRTVNLAGEPLQNALAQQIYALATIGRVFNLYGPTEDTTYSTFTLVRKGAREAPTIGRPIDNSQVYLLDTALQPVPIGVPGELYLGGAGLARGYLNRPELTAERFIPSPLSVVSDQLQPAENKEQRTKNKAHGTIDQGQRTTDNGQRTTDNRLYKTGDLARFLPNGEIEYLGRIDGQIKLRGFRIELGEVEWALAQHPTVRTTVVLVREDVPGDKRLVAYVVPSQEQRTKPVLSEVEGNKEQRSEKEASQFSILNSQFSGELRQFLRDRLPGYMVPAAFVLLDALPLTPNGKIDRRALPAPDMGELRERQGFTAPRSPLEQELAAIWAELLGVEQVGVHDNFFELGGHSLLATRVAHRVRELYQVEPPLQVFFEEPTVSRLATIVEEGRVRAPAQPQPRLQALPRGRKSAAQLLAELGRLHEDEAQTLLDEKQSR